MDNKGDENINQAVSTYNEKVEYFNNNFEDINLHTIDKVNIADIVNDTQKKMQGVKSVNEVINQNSTELQTVVPRQFNRFDRREKSKITILLRNGERILQFLEDNLNEETAPSPKNPIQKIYEKLDKLKINE